MTEGREFHQRAEGQNIAQAGPGGTATAINHTHVRPKTVDPAKLAEAQRLLEELPLNRVPAPGGMPAGSKPPPDRSNPLLVGREEDFKVLATKIKGAAGPPTVIVSGIGGVGKTQLAGEFAHRYGRYFMGGVYWLNLSDTASIQEEVAACGRAGAMNLSASFQDLSPDDQIGAVMSEWYSDLPRLLVLDDCADGRTLEEVRPSAGGCRVLVTRRGPMTDPALGTVAFALETLARAASVELLHGYYDGAGEAELGKIAVKLGDLPLALNLAGRYLRRYRHITDAGQYLQKLRFEEVLGHRSLQDVGRTFAVSIRRLEEGDGGDLLAVRLLARSARFEPEKPIDRRLLLSTLGSADEDPTLQQLEEREDALARLVDLGLIRELESGQVSMHVLVTEAARREIEDDEAQASVERVVAIEVMEVVRAKQPIRLEPLMPHLRQVLDAVGNRFDKPAYLLRFAMGHALLASRYPAEAAPYLRSAVEYNEALLQGCNDPEERQNLRWLIMRQRSDLTVAFERAGDSELALETHEELLEDRRNNLPQPHEDVASTLTNIGVLKARRRLLHEVMPLYEEALDIREAVLAQKDDDDPERSQLQRDVAESHSNLGAFYMDLGRPHQAVCNYRRAVDIYEDLEETENETYADYNMALGAMLRLLGYFEDSRNHLERALRINKRVLPEDSTQIVKNLILLGTLLAGEAVSEGGCE